MTQQLNISDSTAMLHDAGFQRIMNAFGLTPSRTHLPPKDRCPPALQSADKQLELAL